jgi:hypothetical protein
MFLMHFLIPSKKWFPRLSTKVESLGNYIFALSPGNSHFRKTTFITQSRLFTIYPMRHGFTQNKANQLNTGAASKSLHSGHSLFFVGFEISEVDKNVNNHRNLILSARVYHR